MGQAADIEVDDDPLFEITDAEAHAIFEHMWGPWEVTVTECIIKHSTCETSKVSGEIYHDGNLAGTWRRSWSWDFEHEQWLMSHDSMGLKGHLPDDKVDYRRRGFATNWIDLCLGAYREWGFGAVKVDAQNDGRYVWSRMGFVCDQDTWRALIDTAMADIDDLHENEEIDEDEREGRTWELQQLRRGCIDMLALESIYVDKYERKSAMDATNCWTGVLEL